MWNSSASGRKLVMRSAKVGSGAAAKRHELTRRRTVTGRALVQLDVGLLNNRGERLALLASEVCKGLAGKAGELDCKGIEAFAYIRLLADGIHQHLAAKVLARTVAGCGVCLIWIGLNPRDELREASGRDGGMHYKQVGLNSHQVKIGEVLVGVVAEVFLQDRRIDGKASGGANADRVTVRCGLRQARDANYASGAHPIFDHELLAETCR